MVTSLHTPAQRRLQLFLAELRRRKGLKQSELAAQIGRRQTFVSKYEIGERRIDVVEFCEIIAAMGEDPGAMLTQLMTIPAPK